MMKENNAKWNSQVDVGRVEGTGCEKGRTLWAPAIRTRSGQAGLETMAAWAFILILFAFVLGIYFTQGQSLAQVQTYVGARQVCQRMALMIDAAVPAPYYTSANYTLPALIGNSNYSVSVFANTDYVRVDTYDPANVTRANGAGCELRTSNVTNSTGGSAIKVWAGNNVWFNKTDTGIVIG